MKTIALSHGLSAIVDEEWYDELSKRRWFALRTSGKGKLKKTPYAMSGEQVSGRRIPLLMHRIVAGAQRGQEVDHINGNGLDNRACNLRIVTSSQNNRVRAKRPSKSGYRGVACIHGKFAASITIGTFHTAEEAARAYDALSAALFGEWIRPNFPLELTDTAMAAE